MVRDAPPAVNIELRGERVYLAFPYEPAIVDAVRAIPGRRFDWDAREWSVPASDRSAGHVRGIVTRWPHLRLSLDARAWVERFGDAWVGRVSACRHDGRGWFVLQALAGHLPDALAAALHGDSLLPLTAPVAAALAALPGARIDPRAARCVTALQVGRTPAPASLTLIADDRAPRFSCEVNWDGAALGAFLELPEADRTARSIPADPYLVEPLERFLARFEVDVDPTARELLRMIRVEHDHAVEGVRRSRAVRANPIAAAGRLGGTLEPFQHAGVRYVLDARRCFLADEQGLGKTVQALAALEADDAFPAIVVCPASLKLNWEREAGRWLPHRTTAVVQGTGGLPREADITILNYDVVHAHRERLLRRAPRALVLDESHYCKNPRARRTRATRALARALPEDALRLALTGTPVLNRPDELISQLRIIGRLEDFGSGAEFAQRFRGMGAEQRLHWHLRRSCFARRLKREVLPQLPAKRRVVVPVALTNEAEYRQAEDDIVAWLRSQPLDLSVLEAKVAATLRAERLAQLTALKRLAARGKLAAALAWIGDFLESEERLVVFAHHQEVHDALMQRFPQALHLLGRDSLLAREEAVRAFQQDPDAPRLIVCSTRVAAQGITLTRASNVCFLELDWTPAILEQAEDRVHRMGQHDAVTAWYLLAADTIDETTAALLERKRGVIGAVTDGRQDDSPAMVESVVAALRARPVAHLRAV